MRLRFRRLIPLVAPVIALLTATCSDTPTPGGPTTLIPHGTVAFNAVFAPSVRHATVLYDAAGLEIDRARVVVVRPPADTLKDTTIVFQSGDPDKVLPLRLSATPGEQLTAGLQFKAGDVVLYSGTATVTVTGVNEPPPNEPPAIVVVPVGPGAAAVSVNVTPASGTYPTSAPVVLTGHALLADNSEIPGALFGWDVSDPTVATVNSSGTVQPTTKGGTVVVTASTLNDISGTATLTFVAPAAQIVTVSGSGQTGVVASTLQQPFVVQLQNANGAGVAGQTVLFGTSGGASVGTASATTDANGRAQSTLTLGQTVGSYSFAATSGTLTTSATATATAGAASTITAVSGGGQHDVIQKTLTNPLVVKVVDQYGNATSGVTVTWATSGPGAPSATSTTTGVDGQTSVTYTLGAQPGTETITASAVGVKTPVTFTETADQGQGTTVTWTGAVSTDWTVAGNWNGGVPSATSKVVIPAGTPNQPTLASVVSVTDVTVANGATLSLGASSGLSVGGNLDGGTGPGITGTQGAVVMTGTSATLRGFVSNLVTNGNVTVSAATTISSALVVNAASSMVFSASAPLTVGTLGVVGHVTVASGNTVNATTLAVSGTTGLLTQTGGAITLSGDAVFQGANTEGQMTGGTLTIGGSLTQTSASSGANFSASAGHRTIFTGTGTRKISFDNPSASFSHFGDLELDGTGTTTLGSGVFVAGQLISQTGATPVTSAGVRLSVSGLDVDGMTFDNTYLTAGGTLTRFDNVTFQNYSAGQIPLTIVHPGSALPFTINNTQFLVTPTTGGAYLEADDSNPTDQNVFTIHLLGSTPGDGSAKTITTGGAVVTWPTVTPGTNKWITGTTGNWSDATKWSLARVPITGDSVVIDAAGNYSVTLDVAFTASTITIGGSGSQAALDVINQTLTVNKQIYNLPGATLYLSGATLTGAGSVSNQGSLTLSAAAVSTPIANQGTINASGTIGLSGALTTTASSKLSVVGEPINRGTLVTVANGFTNNGTIELNATGGAYSGALTIANGTLTNAVGATITGLPGTGGTRTLDGSLDNQGTLTTSAILLIAPTLGSVTNSGTINISGGLNVQIGGTTGTRSFTNSGTITMAANSGIAMPGGQFISQPTATLNGAGKAAFTNTTVTLDGTVSMGGLDVTGGAIALKSNVAVTGTGMSFTSTSVTGAGVLTNAAGQTTTLTGTATGATTLSNTGGFVNRGILTTIGGVTINTPLTTASTSTINISQGSSNNTVVTIANGFTNLGALNFSTVASNRSANLTVTTGTLVNGAGATIAVLTGPGGNSLTVPQINNQGTINVASALNFGASTATVNSGTFNVTGGNVNISVSTGTFTNSGTLSIAPGFKVAMNAGTITHQAGATLNGGGELDLTSTNMAFNAPFTLSALSITNNTTVSFAANVNVSTANTALTIGSVATINGPGTITNVAGKTLTLNSAVTMNAPLVNQGDLIVIDNNNSINGTYTDAKGATLSVYSQGQQSNGSLKFANGFTNNGTIDLTSKVDAYPSSLTVTTGTLINAASGIIKASVGTGGARTLAAPFHNAGTITAAGPLLVNYTDSSSNNSGVIDASAGDITITQTVASGAPNFFNDGGITVGTGHTFTVTGGTFNNDPTGVMTGAGSAVINNATANFGNTSPGIAAASFNTVNLNINGAFSSATTTLSFDKTTVNGQGTITNVSGKTITVANGSVIAVPFTNQGTFNAINNGNVISFGYTDDPKATLNIYADGKNGTAGNLTLSNSVSNNGAINLTSQGGAFSSQLTITGGNAQFLNYGTINSLAGTGGTRAIVLPAGATMTHYGIIDINPGGVGELDITGNVSIINSGTVRTEMASLTSFDLLKINGRLSTDGGHITATPLGSYVPASKDIFRVITYNNGTGGNPFLTVDTAGWSGSGSTTTYSLTKN